MGYIYLLNMGPKKGGESKKAEKKKQDKVIEDKTFGLKNKNKSAAVQKYIKGVEQTVKGGKGGQQQQRNEEYAEKAAKKKAREEEAFLNSLYKTVKTIKQEEVAEGESAKTVLCAYFKAGQCTKGNDCEYSHDLNVEFNQGAFDIYTDIRDVKKKDGPESEIHKIAEEKERKRAKVCQSNIVCKFFLKAVQSRVYGYKWECPNGDDCHYRHSLPKDYVITTAKDKIQEEMTIDEFYNWEEEVDAERDRLGKNGTPVNDETFKEWKKRRDEFRLQNKEEAEKKKKSGQTGRQLFKNQNNLFKDDDNAADDVKVDENNQAGENEVEKVGDELKGVKIDEELFAGDENLDGLDDIVDDEEPNNEEEKETDS